MMNVRLSVLSRDTLVSVHLDRNSCELRAAGGFHSACETLHCVESDGLRTHLLHVTFLNHVIPLFVFSVRLFKRCLNICCVQIILDSLHCVLRI